MALVFLRMSLLLSSLITPLRAAMTTRHIHLKRTISGLYRPHRNNPVLFDPERFLPQWVHPDLLEIVEHFQKQPAGAGMIQQDLPDPLQKELDGVYSFNAFSNEFLTLLNEEIENFYQASEKHQIPVRRPNSMNNYGVILNEIGLKPLITRFQKEYLWPLSRQLFPQEASQFDDHHSFIVRYQAEEDLGLDMHTDDSDVTFNVCLGEPGFAGSTLTFCGMFGAPNHRQLTHVYSHQIGRAILHLGSRRHGADDIASGRRMNLIVWSHNWKWRASPAYKRQRTTGYQKEGGPPDSVCLSYTHDVDYFVYKEIPERAKDLDLRPWCPPLGLEYDGFEEKMQAQNKKKEGTKSRDPLDGEL